jgi:hypothetical protein
MRTKTIPLVGIEGFELLGSKKCDFILEVSPLRIEVIDTVRNGFGDSTLLLKQVE